MANEAKTGCGIGLGVAGGIVLGVLLVALIFFVGCVGCVAVGSAAYEAERQKLEQQGSKPSYTPTGQR